MHKLLKKSFITFGLALAGLASLVGASSVSAAVDNTPDCDNVAIIRCGVFTKAEMREKASKGDVPKIFRHLGISQEHLKGEFVNGVVWRDGRVTVDGKVVATGATTAGRNYGGTPIPGTNAGTYPTSKFVTEGQTAFVKLKSDGTFDFAVIKACGNPVKATPKPPKKEEPKPSYECVRLRAEKIDRTTYKFTPKATAKNGASVVTYEYNFGDGYGVTYTEPYTYQYKQPGTYNTMVTAHIKVGNKTKKVTAPACKTTVTITDTDLRVCDLATKQVITIKQAEFDATKHSQNLDDCDTPVTPTNIKVCELTSGNIIEIPEAEFASAKHTKDLNSTECKDEETVEETPVQTIAATGPGAIAAGLFGSSSLGYGAYAYASSRRQLINKMLGR